MKHLAIIMDGNRRWALKNNLPIFEGHRRGVQALKNTIKFCIKESIKYLTVYAFSTENNQREKTEVNFLFTLLKSALKEEIAELNKQEIKIKFIGDIESLEEGLKKPIIEAEELTKNNNKLNLQIAFNYGARNEIINACKKIFKDNLNLANLTEETFEKYLYTASIDEPDLLIRSGGEMRLSNFLLWQCAYTELFFSSYLWPDFNEEILKEILNDFKQRQRRFGK